MPKNMSKNLNDQKGVIEEIRHLGSKVDNIETVLRKEMRRIGAGVERRLGVKIESVEHKVVLLAENQTAMGKKLGATFEMVGGLSGGMTIVKDSLKLVENSLKKKVDIDDFSVIHKKAR